MGGVGWRLVTALLLAAGCNGGGGRDVDAPVPEDAFRPAVGDIVLEEPVEPFATGAGSERVFYVVDDGRLGRELLEAIVVSARADGWELSECVSKHERCLRRPGYFVAAVAAEDSGLPGVPVGYPQPPRPPGDESGAVAIRVSLD